MVIYNAMCDSANEGCFAKVNDMMSDIKNRFCWKMPLPSVTVENGKMIFANKSEILSCAKETAEKLQELIEMLEQESK